MLLMSDFNVQPGITQRHPSTFRFRLLCDVVCYYATECIFALIIVYFIKEIKIFSIQGTVCIFVQFFFLILKNMAKNPQNEITLDISVTHLPKVSSTIDFWTIK